ncbi:MAG TPA: hypothetical protein VHK67_06470 [Rhabdochlamydiaceae bacterium]|jgi:hypothetical protein|nr:hypothetical protein [Rhabdochlamydiaceae bacterium]
MKSTSMTLLASAMLSLTSLISADAATGCEVEMKQCQPANYNRVYAGPEFMWSHFPGNKKEIENGTIKWNPNTYYGGLRFGHEYLKPQDFYSNTDIVALMGTTWAEKKDEKETKAWERTREVFKGKRGHFWGNIEQRLGYTFASSLLPSCTASLYVAPGFHYEHINGSHAYWYYAATGLKAVQQFTDSFHLGCDLKVMYAFGAHDKNNIATDFGRKQFWGYEVGLPFEWKLGETKAFDIQVKPYLLKLDVNSAETLLGARVELGYNF